MPDHKIETNVTGGQIQGVAGAGTVVIENFTIYNRAVEQPAVTGAEPIAPCPYPGLAYFGPDDADLFFGRDVAIARLADAVGRQSLTALVGASGSGKSSVVLAGLAPRLHRGGDEWRFTHFRIGTELERNPFLALARALVPLYVASDSDTERLKNTKLLAKSLETGELTLRDVFADCRGRNKGRRILLIADQFEEAFTLVGHEATRQRFIDVLLAGFPDPAPGISPDICLILTLRADFYGRALRHRPLADALQGHVENLGPMNREELRAAIDHPAANAKVSYEPGLVETLLDDVENKPGGLPLLQFALREMWSRQEKRTITRRSYDDIGGVDGALAQRAETIFAALTENGMNLQMEKAFQRLFTRLVTLGEGQEDTRRVVEHRELGDEVWSLAQRLAGEDNRLVVTNAPALTRETVEVVHEALIRHWPKLVGWINRDRAFQSWLRQIKPNVELWSADPTDEGPLLRGGMLAQGTDWLSRRREDLSPTEQSYIEASLTLSQRAKKEKEAARQAEIRDAQALVAANRRIARRTLVGLAAALVLAALAGWQWRNAETQRERSQRSLALATATANSLVSDLAEKFRNVVGMPAVAIKDILDRARKLQDQLLEAGELGPDLRRSQAEALISTVDTLLTLGETQSALAVAKQAQGIFEALLMQQPDSTDLQRELSVSYGRVGDVQVAQGNLPAALTSYQASLAIRERLAKSDPGNFSWQRDLSVPYDRVGNVQMAQGNLQAALTSYQASLVIRERLAKSDPGNLGGQSDLSVSYNKVGDVQVAQGNLPAALTSYQASLAIRERLAKSDPGNAGWQRNLSLSYDRVGDVQAAQGNLPAALTSYEASLAIRERLAKSDPGNAGWQSDLSASYVNVGDVQVAQGNLSAALISYQASLAIRERLAKSDASNAGWQRNLSVSYKKVGDTYRKAGQSAKAREALAAGRAIIAQLVAQYPDWAQWKQDLAWFDQQINALEK